MTATSSTLIGALRERPEHRTWLEYLEGLQPDEVELYIPRDSELLEILRQLEVPEAYVPQVIAARPDPVQNPDQWWLLERCVASLVTTIGSPTPPPWFPPPMEVKGLDPFFYVHAFVATLPYVRAYHRERGVPEEIARSTLADLGRNVRVHQKRYGAGGLGTPAWIMLHFRGMIYQLGRLQFERSRMRERISDALQDRGKDASPDDLVLSVHIPDFLGPLSPEACDESIAMAKRFFAEHFPEERYRYAVCHSWLLDPQLANYLSESSNIHRFQRRFEVAEGGQDADTSILQFVFGPVPENLDALPQHSTLERAVVSHLRKGGHWQVRSGWFELA